MTCKCDIKKLLTDGHEPWCNWKLYGKPKTDTPAPRETPPLFSNPEEKWFLDVDLMAPNLLQDSMFWAESVFPDGTLLSHRLKHDVVYLSSGGAVAGIMFVLDADICGDGAFTFVYNSRLKDFLVVSGIPKLVRKALP